MSGYRNYGRGRTPPGRSRYSRSRSRSRSRGKSKIISYVLLAIISDLLNTHHGLVFQGADQGH